MGLISYLALPMFHVVDDNLIGAKNTAKIIKLFNEQALVFTSAVTYLDYVRSNGYRKPAAIFTDVLMHHMDGYELMQEILAIHPDQKFVVMSGRPNIDHPSKNRACFYLSKPFYIRDVEKIIDKIDRCRTEGPSPEIGCADDCDRTEFCLNDWRCPQLETLQAHGRQNTTGKE